MYNYRHPTQVHNSSLNNITEKYIYIIIYLYNIHKNQWNNNNSKTSTPRDETVTHVYLETESSFSLKGFRNIMNCIL